MVQEISYIIKRLFGVGKTAEDGEPKLTQRYPPLLSYSRDIIKEHNLTNVAATLNRHHQRILAIPPEQKQQQQEEATLGDPLVEVGLHQPLIATNSVVDLTAGVDEDSEGPQQKQVGLRQPLTTTNSVVDRIGGVDEDSEEPQQKQVYINLLSRPNQLLILLPVLMKTPKNHNKNKLVYIDLLSRLIMLLIILPVFMKTPKNFVVDRIASVDKDFEEPQQKQVGLHQPLIVTNSVVDRIASVDKDFKEPQQKLVVSDDLDLMLAEYHWHQPLTPRFRTYSLESTSTAACVKEAKEVIIEAIVEEATSSNTKRKKKNKKRKKKKNCPRNQDEIPVRKIGPYKSKHKILLVGEGDFSFSASLAIAFGNASNIVTTSLDTKAFLQKNYKMAMSNIMELEKRGSCVIHGVDATKVSKHASLEGMKFDRIIFNFPHTCTFGRTTSDISRNQKLVLGFLRNAKNMIEEDGEIHVTHKTSRTYIKWNIVQLGLMEGLCLIEECPFDPRVYPGYNTKYGFGGDKDFDFFPCNSYKFGLVCFARFEEFSNCIS